MLLRKGAYWNLAMMLLRKGAYWDLTMMLLRKGAYWDLTMILLRKGAYLDLTIEKSKDKPNRVVLLAIICYFGTTLNLLKVSGRKK